MESLESIFFWMMSLFTFLLYINLLGEKSFMFWVYSLEALFIFIFCFLFLCGPLLYHTPSVVCFFTILMAESLLGLILMMGLKKFQSEESNFSQVY